MAPGFTDKDEGFMRYPFDEPGIYAIQVAGEVDESWSARLGGMTIFRTEIAEEEHKLVSVLIGAAKDVKVAAALAVLKALIAAKVIEEELAQETVDALVTAEIIEEDAVSNALSALLEAGNVN